METPIYLDYAAATPLDDEVAAAMTPYLSGRFYNPSASYQAARQVKADLEEVRKRIALPLGAKPAEIVFTAGAAEANNLAITGVMTEFPKANVLVGAIEHETVLAPAKRHTHKLIPVNAKGTIDLDKLSGLIDNNTVLISIGYANNETGTIQPLSKVAKLVQGVRRQRLLSHNKLPLYLHSDAAQAAPYLDLHTARLGVDLMTLNGSKMYGPKQVGLLFVQGQVQIEPLIVGGGQERGLRSGTENVAGIIGLAVALENSQLHRKEASRREAGLRDSLQNRLSERYDDQLVVSGDQKHRLPNTLNVAWPGLDGERLVMLCDEYGLQLATGAACSANKERRSHVLSALGLSDETVDGSIRITLGRQTTGADIDRAAQILIKAVAELER
ncbi:MAG TPA: cysteine desulfurase family protein [Candidatus Saccharimonadales bacterium]|nr:cysteine desulfurase family protein [Candidatus Saccharimonadales bacterium]